MSQYNLCADNALDGGIAAGLVGMVWCIAWYIWYDMVYYGVRGIFFFQASGRT